MPNSRPCVSVQEAREPPILNNGEFEAHIACGHIRFTDKLSTRWASNNELVDSVSKRVKSDMLSRCGSEMIASLPFPWDVDAGPGDRPDI